MDVECTVKRCGTPSQRYLCQYHQDELADMILHLPQWLEYLDDARLGQTKLGESVRRSTDQTSPMPVNMTAGNLRTRIWDTLRDWNVHAVAQMTPEWAAMLADSAAGQETAGRFYGDIDWIIRAIERVINRPEPERTLGPCPNPVRLKGERRSHMCGTRLTAKADATEVKCPACKAIFEPDVLLRHTLANIDNWRFTTDEILTTLELLGTPIPRATFYDWRAKGKFRPVAWRKRDGTVVHARDHHNDQPLYVLAPIRKLIQRKDTKPCGDSSGTTSQPTPGPGTAPAEAGCAATEPASRTATT